MKIFDVFLVFSVMFEISTILSYVGVTGLVMLPNAAKRCVPKMAYFCFIRRHVKHKMVDDFGTNRDILINFFVVDHHNYGVE